MFFFIVITRLLFSAAPRPRHSLRDPTRWRPWSPSTAPPPPAGPSSLKPSSPSEPTQRTSAALLKKGEENKAASRHALVYTCATAHTLGHRVGHTASLCPAGTAPSLRRTRTRRSRTRRTWARRTRRRRRPRGRRPRRASASPAPEPRSPLAQPLAQPSCLPPLLTLTLDWRGLCGRSTRGANPDPNPNPNPNPGLVRTVRQVDERRQPRPQPYPQP